MSRDLPFKSSLMLLFLISVFLLALTKTVDVDVWIHLSFGRLIWEMKGFPAFEPFVYSMLDKPFSYSSWLFGVICYLSYHLGSFSGLILLKAVVITLTFLVLLKDSLKPRKNHFVAVVVLGVVLVIARDRFVERPDVFLMLFLSFTIFCLNAFIYDDKKYLYSLPLVHVLWANSHSSINLMPVLYGAFIIGGLVQNYIAGRFSMPGLQVPLNKIRTMGAVFLLSFAASLASPYFIGQYTFSAQFLTTDWYKQEILELRPPMWYASKSPYLLTGALFITYLLNGVVLYRMKSARSSDHAGAYSAFFIHLLLMILFIYLSFTAVRFIFLFAVVSGPVLARYYSALFSPALLRLLFFRNTQDVPERREYFGRRGGLIMPLLTAVWIVVYSALSLLNIKPFESGMGQEFGLGVNYELVPEGALQFMDRKGISGRIYNIFQWGQYITWRDFPKRSAIIDGRGYVTPELLKKMELSERFPRWMKELSDAYGFESVLLQYPARLLDPRIEPDKDVAFSSPDWALVYWDDVSLLYVKRGGTYDSVVRSDEYHFIKPANSPGHLRPLLENEADRDNIITELKRNIAESGSSRAYAILGYVYNETGEHRKAIDSFSKVKETLITENLTGDALTGTAYALGKLGELDESIGYYAKALAKRKDARIYLDMASVYRRKGDDDAALASLEKAVQLNPELTSAYAELIDHYHKRGWDGKAGKAEELLEKIQAKRAGDEHYLKGTRAYLEGDGKTAVEELMKSIELDPSNAPAYSNLGYVYWDLNKLDMAFACHQKALEIEPNFANAHYGIALVYRKWGRKEMARKHWEKYLDIEPDGYYARKAKKELQALQ